MDGKIYILANKTASLFFTRREDAEATQGTTPITSGFMITEVYLIGWDVAIAQARAEEREACATVIMDINQSWWDFDDMHEAYEEIAAAIRARMP